MTISSTVALNVNGANRSITTGAFIEDIDKNGIAWCEPVRKLATAPFDPILALGVYLNLANICRSQGRAADEMAALRCAKRIGGVDVADIERAIAGSPQVCRYVPLAGFDEYSIVSFADDRAAFETLLEPEKLVPENLYYAREPYSRPPGTKDALPQMDGVEDLSFHVCSGAKRLATVPLSLGHDGIARWAPLVTNYGPIPARIHLADDCRNPSKTINAALDYLMFLMRSYGIKEAALQEPRPAQMLLYKLLGRHHLFSAEIWYRPVVHLDQTDNAIFAGVRDSYKSNINWCRANLSMTYYDRERLHDGAVAEVRSAIQTCHRKVIQSRGDNMTPGSFDLAISMCRANHGEAAIARTAEGAVCGVTVTTDDAGVAYYALGGQIQLGNKNPGHFMLFDALVRAKRRGLQRFHPNTLAPPPIQRELLDITARPRWQVDNFFFKRGFSDDLDIVHVYRIFPTDVTIFGPR